mgnify:CR=1 FL=1
MPEHLAIGTRTVVVDAGLGEPDPALRSAAHHDLLVVRGNERLGFEIKRTSSPTVTAPADTKWYVKKRIVTNIFKFSLS